MIHDCTLNSVKTVLLTSY